MHEYAVTKRLVEIVLEEASKANLKKVTRIKVVLGTLRGFVPQAIEFYFSYLTKNSLAEGATLDFEIIEAKAKCLSCGKNFNPQETLLCPFCKSPSVEIMKGEEFYIESIEGN